MRLSRVIDARGSRRVTWAVAEHSENSELASRARDIRRERQHLILPYGHFPTTTFNRGKSMDARKSFRRSKETYTVFRI